MTDEQRLLESHLERIRQTAAAIDGDVTVMEICGGHTNVILGYGIRDLLPDNVRLISGPGCPVCVSAQRDIDCVIELAGRGVPVATYGDMLRVPGTRGTLERAKAQGHPVYEVYSAADALSLREKHDDLVFFGVGFETTAPMSTHLLEHGVPVYSVHKLVPPAMRALTAGDVAIDGFIDPGHVSTIIGAAPYREIKVPQVIAGFTAERVIRALSLLLELIRDDTPVVVNGYPEAVREEGNRAAREKLDEHFSVEDSEWRGLGRLPRSGFEVRADDLNAKRIHEDALASIPEPEDTGCRCGDVLRGFIEPVECPLYKTRCRPDDPQGACMVSAEGSCSISCRYGK